jgi:hypothetical protein
MGENLQEGGFDMNTTLPLSNGSKTIIFLSLSLFLLFGLMSCGGGGGGGDTVPPTTSASPVSGIYGTAQSIILTANEPATIYYTLDGTMPAVGGAGTLSGSSPVTGIPISHDSTLLQFFAVDSSGNREAVKSQTYVVSTGDTTGPGDMQNYFPVTQGNTWNYEVTATETGFPTTTSYESISIAGTKQFNGVTAVVLKTAVTGAEEYLYKNSRAVTYLGNTDPADPITNQLVPYQAMLFTLQPGSSFVQANKAGVVYGEDLDGDMRNETATVKSIVTVKNLEPVTVPAGTFSNCARIVTDLTLAVTLSSNKARITVTAVQNQWFAPGIGPVQTVTVTTASNYSSTETEKLTGYVVDGNSGGVVTSVLTTAPYPSHLTERGGNLYWSDASDSPVNRISVAGGAVLPLARKIGVPAGFAVRSGFVYWIDVQGGIAPSGAAGPDVIRILKKTSLDGSSTTVLQKGEASAGGTTEIAVDDQNVYWVNSTSTPNTYTVKKTPISNSGSVTLVSTSVPISAMARDATYLYWVENLWPDPGTVQSYIKKMPLGGGDTSIVLQSNSGLTGNIAINGTDIFYADIQYPYPGNYRLMKVSISGGVPTILAELTAAPVKIAVNDGNVYWIDGNSVNVMPAEGGSTTTLASGLNSPVDLAINSGTVFWTETVCCGYGQTGSIKEVPVTGGTVTVLVDGVDAPGAVALDMSNVYWTEGGPTGLIEGFGRIAKVPIGGGVSTTVVSGISSDSAPLAIDGTNVYIADKFTIKKVPINGGIVEKVTIAYDSVADIATDGTYVYWLEGPFSNVRKFPINGGSVTALANGSGPAGKIVVSNGIVYWMEGFDTIKKVPAAGGDTVTVSSGLPFLSDFVVDGSNVYFSEQDSGNINSVPVGGGTISTLASGQRYSYNILAVDSGNLYWIDQVEIGKVPVSGGDVTFIVPDGLVSDPTFPNSIAVDGTSVYWTETGSGEIKRITTK